MNTVKRWLAAFLSTAMVFTCAPFANVGVLAAAATTVAGVTTDRTTSEIEYDSIGEAISQTNNADNAKDNAVIKLYKNATISSGYSINIPLTIDLNGYKLTEKDDKKLSGGSYSHDNITDPICRADNDSTIVFAIHNPRIVYDWKYNASADLKWQVVSKTTICDNCGASEPSTVELGETTYNKTEDQYEYRENGVLLDTRPANTEVKGYTLDTEAYISNVNGVNQHTADGLPVVKAILKKNDTGAPITVNADVVAATEEELKATGIVVYDDKYGTSGVAENTPATCTEYGKVVYKVVVTDPDGQIQEEVYLRDTQGIAKLDHTQGALKNIELLTKSSSGYDTEAKAKTAASNAKATVVKITSKDTKLSNGTTETKYYYWSWVAESDITGAGSGSTRNSSITDDKSLNVSAILDENNSFTYRPVFYCDAEEISDKTNSVTGDEVTVSPYENATTNEAYQDGKHSKCEAWVYPSISITYECSRSVGAVVKSTYTYTRPVSNVPKDSADYSHVSNGEKYDVNPDPTCTTPGTATLVCAICKKANATNEVAKLSHTYGKYESTEALTATMVDSGYASTRNVTLNSSKTEATVTATCVEDGGVYKYCTGKNNDNKPHWEKQETLKATGHDLSMVIGSVNAGTWSDGTNDTGNVEAVYDKNKDYTYTVLQQCKNPGCNGATVTYHSITGTDTETDVYNAFTIVDEEKGADCQTYPKTTYTVNGLSDTIGNAITTEFKKTSGKKGDHVLEVTSWNWSNDFEAATASVKCTVKDCTTAPTSVAGKVTKEVASNGVTTFTATYGDYSEAKKAYTLKDAKVTYDTSLITDGNLVGKSGYGTEGAAPQLPDVTVTIDGTVIDEDSYVTSWTYKNNRVVATVDWSEDIKDSKDPVVIDGTKSSEDFYIAAKKTFVGLIDTTIFDNDEEYDGTTYKDSDGTSITDPLLVDEDYDPEASYSVVTESKVKNTTVKYALVDKAIGLTKAESKITDADKKSSILQSKIEALDFNLDGIKDIKDAGKYYVYAQVSADGYTTYTTPEPAATIIISKKYVKVYVDNATVIEGDKPNLHIRAVDANNREVNIDPADFTITTVGGESIENLKAGDYRLRVTAENYNIETSEANYVAVLTVLAKDGSSDIEQAEAEAVVAQINALTDESSAEDIAAARAAYDKLNDTQKARVNAETLKKLTDAEDKVAADKIVDQLNKATTDADKAAAYEAYSKLSDAQKKLVDAKAADAVAAAKTAKDAADKAAAEEAAKKEAAAKEATTKTATTAKTAAAKVASTNPKYSAVQSAVKALDKVLADKNATSAQIKAATDKVNAAVTASKTAGAKKGATYTVGGQKYKATSAKAVTLTKAKNAKSVTVPATVKINGKKIAVTKIGAKAFAKSKATKVTIKTKKLTKKGVKNSLKGSKVKTVKVSCGKAYVKKYKKFFTKANAGKKVTVK